MSEQWSVDPAAGCQRVVSIAWLFTRRPPMLARVFLAARYILDRLLGSRSRADEVYDVRRRLLEMNGPGMASGEEEELARKLLLLREQLLVQLGHVEACAQCVR